MLLASDVNNPDFAGAMNPDSVLHVTFYQRAIKNDFLSLKENRPIYEDVDFVRIEKPGDTLSIIDTPSRKDHADRFPLQWARYQNNKSADQTIGTPVEEWPRLEASQREMLKAMNFRTVDSIANASDAQIQQVGMLAGMAPMAFREQAKIFLRRASDTADAALRAAESEKLREQNEELHKQMQAMMADMNSLRKQIEDKGKK